MGTNFTAARYNTVYRARVARIYIYILWL